jgi:hypothetical protein
MFSIRYLAGGWFIFLDGLLFYSLSFESEWEALDDLAVMRPKEASELRRIHAGVE